MTILYSIWIVTMSAVATILGLVGLNGVWLSIFPKRHKDDYEIRVLAFILSLGYCYASYWLFAAIL